MKRHACAVVAKLTTVFGLLVAAPPPAGASPVEWCVSNHNDLQQAAEQAEEAPTTIKFMQGTYDLAGTAFTNPHATFKSFSLLGGYSGTLCSSRVIDPSNTMLTSSGDGAPLIDVTGDVTLEGIHFAGSNAGLFVSWSDYFHDIPANIQFTMRRNIVTGSAGGSAILVDWGVAGGQNLTARIIDNLFHDNGDGSGGACNGSGGGVLELSAEEDANAIFDVINNTIVDNGLGGGICAGYSGSLTAYNNVLYNNYGPDFYTESGTTATLFNNLHQTQNFKGPAIEFGKLNTDPKLDAQFHPVESPASPVINSGDNAVPGGLPAVDLAGNPRLVGSTVDRGAYESSIDDELIQTVTNTGDSGDGSLRAAIASANANGSGLITFDIGSGCGPQVITLQSPLPPLTAGMIINGYTQTGSSPNDLDTGDDATLCVILESGDASVTRAFQVPSSADDSTAVSIKGFGFSGFSDAAIDLQAGSFHEVAGNHFGGNVGGRSLQANGNDVRLGVAAHDSLIGGDDDGDRNIIGGASGSGLVLQGGSTPPFSLGSYNNQIIGNMIGIGWNVNTSSYTNRANGSRGINLQGHDNTISGNVIADNAQAGILLSGVSASNNVISGNFIGVGADGSSLGNGNAGIHFDGTPGDAPEDNTVRDNVIGSNADEGIWVEIGQGNKLRRNSIYTNGLLGIDLAAEGVNPNDDDAGIQQEDYANHGQNYPVLTSAAGGFTSGYIAGSLSSTGGDFTIDFYATQSCDPSGHGPGDTWIGSGKVTLTVPTGLDEGFATFNVRVTPDIFPPLLNGRIITATATNANGDTSEFSACASYLNDTIFADGFEPPAD